MTEAQGYETRRREVADATLRLIARGGFESVKVRDVAAETGYSTHIVSHYFESKKELLLYTLKACAARQVQRLKAAIGAGASIAECLEMLLPLDEERLVDSRVWMVFWTASLSDPEIADVQRQFGARWRHLIVGMLRIRGVIGAETPRPERNAIAERLQKAVAGIGIHGALGVWSPQRQRELMADEVARVLGDRTPSAAPDLGRHALAPEVEADPAQVENARLRTLLLDAMLEVATLREALAEAQANSASADASPRAA